MRFQPANSKSIPLWTLCILIIQTVTVSAQDRDYVEFGRKALEQQGKLPWYDQKGDQFKSVPLGPIDDKSLIDSDLPFDDEFLNEDLNFDRLEEYLQDPESRRQFDKTCAISQNDLKTLILMIFHLMKSGWMRISTSATSNAR